MQPPLLEGRGVSKSFGGLAAVSKVDFTVESGEVLGLIGPNGAGKTTLFNLISGAIVPQAGSVISFQGQNIAGFAPHRICRMGIARTFQSVKIFGHVSAAANIQTGLLFGGSGVSSSEVRRETERLLEFVGLEGVADVMARDLPLVSQKRLEVARALATNPRILMLDELMAGLNPTEVATAMDLVKAIRDQGITVVMIEHVMQAIMSVCGRIMVLHHGVKIAEGTPQEIATSKTVIEVYLGECAHAGD